MPIEIIKGDAVEALEDGEINVLMHITNCQGVMGSGIAKQIKEAFPKVFKSYREAYDAGEAVLGFVLGVHVSPSKDFRQVLNIHAQEKYGSDKRHLNYGALSRALCKIAEHYKGIHGISIGVPYKMGCDRAGGDWEIVLEMIEFFFKDFNVKVYQL